MEATITAKQEVLDFLKKELYLNGNSNNVSIFYNVNTKDIIKFLEYPEKCSNWPFDFVCMVHEAIKKIEKKYLITYPKIELQTEEDRVLSKLLKKNNFFAFGRNNFFGAEITINHVIAYMERDSVIHNWNAYFIHKVQHEVLRVKEFLLE